MTASGHFSARRRRAARAMPVLSFSTATFLVGCPACSGSSRCSPRWCCRCWAARRPSGPWRWSCSRACCWRLCLCPSSDALLQSAPGGAGPSVALALATLSLPIAISSAFSTPPLHGVSLWVMGLFLASVGFPCFVLSANAPLLQAWFARGGDEAAANAYFLYRASNLGSFLVLLAYPFVIEPSLGLVAAVAAVEHLLYRFWCWRSAAAGSSRCARANRPSDGRRASQRTAPGAKVVVWAALGFVPSGLLVAVTAHIATDVASGPFLWIMPLALYLLTFVFAFSDKPLLPPKLFLALQPFTTATARRASAVDRTRELDDFTVRPPACVLRCRDGVPGGTLSPPARMRAQLTQFYVWMSLGGVLGGAFAALIAPHLFTTVLEYPLLAWARCCCVPTCGRRRARTGSRTAPLCWFVAAALTVPFFVLQGRRSAISP